MNEKCNAKAVIVEDMYDLDLRKMVTVMLCGKCLNQKIMEAKQRELSKYDEKMPSVQ